MTNNTNGKPMNKQELINFLTESIKDINDANLKARVQYTIDHADKATVRDIRSLAKEVKEVISGQVSLIPEAKEEKDAPAEPAPVAEAAVKPKKKVGKKSAETADKPKDAPAEAPKAEEKPKVEEKPKNKKKEKEAPAPDSAVKAEDTKNSTLAIKFADSIELRNGIKLNKVEDIKSFSELRKALEEGRELYFAYFWSKRLLRQFDYSFVDSIQAIVPKAFDNDLDIASILYVSEEKPFAVVISSYTENPYLLSGEKEIEPDEDNIRYSNGMEYVIYEAEAEVVEDK